MHIILGLIALLLGTALVSSSQASAVETEVYRTTSGLCFNVQPALKPSIRKLAAEVRAWIRQHRDQGKFVTYLSVPISSHGGGLYQTNNAIAAHTARRLKERFGDMLLVVNPAEYNIAAVGDHRAGGGDYMAVWGDVLGGETGQGRDFDMVYFLGPVDVWSYFGSNGKNILEKIARWAEDKAQSDADFAKHISDPKNRRDFIRFYGLRASAAYSRGANDEWNLFQRLNSRRETGEDIAIYFNGDAIELSDVNDDVDVGYEVTCQ